MIVPLCTGDFLRRAALVYGNRAGIVDEPQQPAPSLGTMTYAQVEAHARAQAAALDAMGIVPGQRVAIVSHNSARLLLALLGVTAYGRVLVPINYRLNATEVDYIVEHSGASVLLIDPELEESLSGVQCRHRFILGPQSDEAMLRPGVEPKAWTGNEDATATINYTSGTTARPKGVNLTHRSLWLNATTFGLHTQISDRDVYLHTLPMFHCNGWGMPFVLSGVGAEHIVLRKIDGMEILRRVQEHGVTLMCGAPTVVNSVLDAAKSWPGEIPGRGRVRVVVAGAPPPTTTIERVETELGWEFIQIYGLTETAPLLTINRTRAEWDELTPADRAQRLVRAGVPALGVQTRLSASGEVLARGNVVLRGYWNDREASDAALRDGWFHTGDGGHIDDDNHLSITDRKKDVIISGGENVSSIEVEDVLFSHPAVAEVAVIGVPDEKWGETVKALVVVAPGQQTDDAALIAHCRSRLAHYKCPTTVELRDALPRTATGKLQKFKLREPYWRGRDKQVN